MKNKLALGIMQPYFFPYIGYFELIARTNKWIVFDVVQYNTKTWMNRNRILHPTKGWQYISIPVEKSKKGTLIRDIVVQDMKIARIRLLGQLEHYKKTAPYFSNVIDLVNNIFDSVKSIHLVDINTIILEKTCKYIDIPFDWEICSEMNLDFKEVKHPGQWALEISSVLNADCYLNPPGGKDIFIQDEFAEKNIKLEFLDMPDITYDCGKYVFEKNLSIIDVLMWNAPDDLRYFFNLNNGDKYI